MTLARWLFLLRSATLMASSILPSRRAPATAGAKARDCLRAALKAIQRSIITPMDQPDMMNKITTTAFARSPIWCHSESGSQPTACSWKSQAAVVDTLLRAIVAKLAMNMSCFSSSELFSYFGIVDATGDQVRCKAVTCDTSSSDTYELAFHGPRPIPHKGGIGEGRRHIAPSTCHCAYS